MFNGNLNLCLAQDPLSFSNLNLLGFEFIQSKLYIYTVMFTGKNENIWLVGWLVDC